MSGIFIRVVILRIPSVELTGATIRRDSTGGSSSFFSSISCITSSARPQAGFFSLATVSFIGLNWCRLRLSGFFECFFPFALCFRVLALALLRAAILLVVLFGASLYTSTWKLLWATQRRTPGIPNPNSLQG